MYWIQNGCLIQQDCSSFCAAGTNKRLILRVYGQAFDNLQINHNQGQEQCSEIRELRKKDKRTF